MHQLTIRLDNYPVSIAYQQLSNLARDKQSCWSEKMWLDLITRSDIHAMLLLINSYLYNRRL